MTPKEKAKEVIDLYKSFAEINIIGGNGIIITKEPTLKDRLKFAISDINFIINDYSSKIEYYRISQFPGPKNLSWLDEQTKRYKPVEFWHQVLNELKLIKC